MTDYIKSLIDLNKDANVKVAILEDIISEYKVTDEKTQVNFGNLCIALHGYRDVADATESMLLNDNCVKSADGGYYIKVDEECKVTKTTEEEAPGNEGKQANHE